jgi:hypothetical protein
MATNILSCQEKVQVGTLCRKTYADIVLRYEWTNSQTLSGERRDSQQCKVQHHVEGETEVVVTDFGPKASSSSMTVRDNTLLLQQLPPSRN